LYSLKTKVFLIKPLREFKNKKVINKAQFKNFNRWKKLKDYKKKEILHMRKIGLRLKNKQCKCLTLLKMKQNKPPRKNWAKLLKTLTKLKLLMKLKKVMDSLVNSTLV